MIQEDCWFTSGTGRFLQVGGHFKQLRKMLDYITPFNSTTQFDSTPSQAHTEYENVTKDQSGI